MNYYAARQRKDDMRWDYTCRRDGMSWPVGYCHQYEELKPSPYLPEDICTLENNKMRPYKDKFHSDGHKTKEEAEACYRNYLLDHKVRYTILDNQQKQCQVCKDWTQHIAISDTKVFPLCEKHCTREELEKIYPQVGEIWSS